VNDGGRGLFIEPPYRRIKMFDQPGGRFLIDRRAEQPVRGDGRPDIE
jgi:hypothetical protein